jgi:hypothetical protein
MEFKLARFVITCVLGVAGSWSSAVAAALDDWVSQHIGEGEKLLCKREMGGEYFFLTQVGDRVRVGSRLDMTGYTERHEFIAAWVFQNENKRSLAVKVQPIPIREKYVRSGDRIFAENVEYQTLNLKDSKAMAVAIRIKKCPTSECSLQVTRSKEEKQYTIHLCEVPLNN